MSFNDDIQKLMRKYSITQQKAAYFVLTINHRVDAMSC